MSKDLKFLDVEKIAFYADLLGKMISDIESVGIAAYKAHENKIITEDVMTEIHEPLFKQVKILEPRMHACNDELDKRMKADLGINRGPKALDVFLHKIKGDYADIYMSKSEFEFKTESLRVEGIKKAEKEKGIIKLKPAK